MTTPNTADSRTLRVAEVMLIRSMVINDQPVIILNPTLCMPGMNYRLEIDVESGTGWIREEESA